MAVADTIKDKITKWLGLGGKTNAVATVPIVGYNPEVWFEHTTTEPYTLTIHEKSYSELEKKFVHLKTVVLYADAPWPCGKIVRILPQEYVKDD